MSTISRHGDELLTPCTRCGGTLRGQVSEIVQGDGIAWGVSWLCPTCGAALEVCDCGEVPGIYRAALLAHTGPTRLHADATVNDPLRVRLFAVFRRYGVSLTEARDAYTQLTSEGITGTPAEMHLLATRLTEAGATVTLERDSA
jgi:hypothetical protein